jgi:hypothetical protein
VPDAEPPPAPPAALSRSPGALAFDPLPVGSSSAPQTFTVTNGGGSPSGQPAVTVGGDFTEGTNGCTSPLDPGESCTVTVRFEPAQPGMRSGTVSVTATPGGAVMATLTGTGLAPAMLALAPRRAAFGSVRVGTTSQPQTFTLRNGGGVPAQILQVGLEGANTRDFEVVTDGCTGMLDAGATCAIDVRFVPTAAGARAANLAITGNPGGKVTAALDGAGVVPAPRLQIVPAMQDFGPLFVGAAGGGLGFEVRNTGDAPSGPVAVRIAGTHPRDFVIVSDGCKSTPLAPGASCPVAVRFGPTAAGARSGVLQAAGTPGGMPTSALSGSGLSITIAPAALTFTGVVGMRSQPQTLTVTNGTGVATGALAVVASGPNAGSFVVAGNSCEKVPLPAGATCAIQVLFLPMAPGPATATVTVTGGGTASAGLSGMAMPPPMPALMVTPNPGVYRGMACDMSLTFTATNTGGVATGPLRVTVTNSGDVTNFAIPAGVPETCTGTSLASAATCAVTVHFFTRGGTNFNGTLTIGDGQTANITVPLSASVGVCTVAPPLPVP